MDGFYQCPAFCSQLQLLQLESMAILVAKHYLIMRLQLNFVRGPIQKYLGPFVHYLKKYILKSKKKTSIIQACANKLLRGPD